MLLNIPRGHLSYGLLHRPSQENAGWESLISGELDAHTAAMTRLTYASVLSSSSGANNPIFQRHMSAEAMLALWEETELGSVLLRLRDSDLTGRAIKRETEARGFGGYFDVYRGRLLPGDRAVAIRQLRYPREDSEGFKISKVRGSNAILANVHAQLMCDTSRA